MRRDEYTDISDAELKKIDPFFEVYNAILNDCHCIYKYHATETKLNMIEDCNNLSINDYMDREILVSYLAKIVGISCVSPMRVKYNDYYGLLEEDYNKEGYLAISGYEILEAYLNHLLETRKVLLREIDSQSKYIAENLNNLVSIQKALTYYFRNEEDSEEIVNDLFSEIVRRFAFDFITLQKDRGPGNWAILVGKGKYPRMTLMYDNEEAFVEKASYQMKVNSRYETNVGIITSLFEHLHDDYINIFMEVINTLTEDKFLYALERMELERGKLPSKAKEQIIKMFHKHYLETKTLLCQRAKKKC